MMIELISCFALGIVVLIVAAFLNDAFAENNVLILPALSAYGIFNVALVCLTVLQKF